MKVKRIIHKGWEEWEKLPKKLKMYTLKTSFFGKYQYFYSSVKGEISLVKIKSFDLNESWIWEMYCLKGNLFEDCERYKTKKQAVERIKELL